MNTRRGRIMSMIEDELGVNGDPTHVDTARDAHTSPGPAHTHRPGLPTTSTRSPVLIVRLARWRPTRAACSTDSAEDPMRQATWRTTAAAAAERTSVAAPKTTVRIKLALERLQLYNKPRSHRRAVRVETTERELRALPASRTWTTREERSAAGSSTWG